MPCRSKVYTLQHYVRTVDDKNILLSLLLINTPGEFVSGKHLSIGKFNNNVQYCRMYNYSRLNVIVRQLSFCPLWWNCDAFDYFRVLHTVTWLDGIKVNKTFFENVVVYLIAILTIGHIITIIAHGQLESSRVKGGKYLTHCWNRKENDFGIVRWLQSR